MIRKDDGIYIYRTGIIKQSSLEVDKVTHFLSLSDGLEAVGGGGGPLQWRSLMYRINISSLSSLYGSSTR